MRLFGTARPAHDELAGPVPEHWRETKHESPVVAVDGSPPRRHLPLQRVQYLDSHLLTLGRLDATDQVVASLAHDLRAETVENARAEREHQRGHEYTPEASRGQRPEPAAAKQ